MDQLRLQFLGTGAGEGIPTPFCRCRVCEHARKQGGKDVRLRSCFRVSDELLIDMGTDLFSACIRCGTDLYDLRHVLVTHTHEDHFDLFNLFLKTMISRGNGEKVHVYLTKEASDIVSVFDSMGLDGEKDFFSHQLERCFCFHRLSFWEETQIGAYLVTPIPGSHRGHLEPNSANYLIRLPDGRTLLYALDTGAYSEEVFSFLKGRQIDLLVTEATFGSCDRGDTPYSHLDLHSALFQSGRLYQAGALTDASRVYLTHLNQEQEFTHEEMEAYLLAHPTPYPVRVAYDGLCIGKEDS